MRSLNNAKLVAAILGGLIGFAEAGQAGAAPNTGGASSGGGAVHSGGGGGAVSSGVHASAPAPSVSHSEPAASSGGQHLVPPAAGQQSVGTPAVNSTAAGKGERSHPLPGTPEHRVNPYHERLRLNQANGAYYNYPYFPLSYGYNNGWYTGNNFASTDFPYYTPFDTSNFTNNSEQTTTPAAAQQATPDTTYSAQQPPTSASPSSAAIQAQIDNAVDKSPALTSANSSVALAQSTLDRERERVLAELRSKPEYQQALQHRHEAAGEVRNAQATAGAGSNAVVAAAGEKLDASDDVTKMEEQAVATDPAASAAKGRLEQAVADRNELRAQLTAQYQAAAK